MGKGKRRVYTDYCERGFAWGNPGMLKSSVHICKHCNFTAKRYLVDCPSCHSQKCMEDFGYKARPPRKGAAKRVWKAFRERFNK
jgi:predicted ATP-dependent serine protease